MTNKEKVIEGVSQWLTKVATSVMPQVKVSPASGVGKFMSMLGIDAAEYNVWDELGFLLSPTIKNFVSPTLAKYIDIIPDEDIFTVANDYVDAMIEQAKEKEYVNVLGIQLGVNAFEGLKEILNSKL